MKWMTLFSTLVLATPVWAAPKKPSTPSGHPALKPARVEVSVTEEGFVVANKGVLHAGQPVTLVVTRKVERTCVTDVVLKAYGISRPLPLNQPVEVTFTPAKPGQVHVACAMDMVSTDLSVE